MSTTVSIEHDSASIINNYSTFAFEVSETGVQVIVEYLSEDWDEMRSNASKDVIAQFEKALKALQTKACLGRHPIRYSEITRPTPLCDIPYVVVKLLLAEKSEDQFTDLLDRIKTKNPLLHIPTDEINQLKKKLGQSKKERYTAPPLRRWRL